MAGDARLGEAEVLKNGYPPAAGLTSRGRQLRRAPRCVPSQPEQHFEAMRSTPQDPVSKKFFHSTIANYWTRFGLAVTLLAMFVVILASTFWEDAYIGDLRKDCASLYADRLMPATTLFLLNDHVHTKRLLLEEYLMVDGEAAERAGEPKPSQGDVHYSLGMHDAAVEYLIGEIEHTYLVGDESRLLHELREAVRGYNVLERELLVRHDAGKEAEYDAEIRAAFGKVRKELLGLTEVQRSVGRKLSDDSVSSAASASFLLHFQLGVAFVLGLLASALAMSLRPQRQPLSLPPRNGVH